MDFVCLYENCSLCPRHCNINRLENLGVIKTGFCGETNQLRVGYIGPHFGEEPPISGKNGSGTVFLSGCSLLCSFCQNYQISHQGQGVFMSSEELLLKLENMVIHHNIHNFNFVTPDHFFPHIFHVIISLRKKGIHLPIIFNTSGYQSVDILKYAEKYVDIYLPDFKYSDSALASALSKCKDYPQVALNAIAEMIRQKGFLDVFKTDDEIAGKGVLVRHLILPNQVENSINALTSLFIEFGKHLPLSLMSQYHPVRNHDDKAMNRFLFEKEFDEVYSHVMDLGFENLFVQFPKKRTGNNHESSSFLPNFTLKEPFRGRAKKQLG